MSRTKGCFHQFPCEIIVFSFSNNWKLPCAFNSRHFPNANRWTCVIYREHVKGVRNKVHFELGRRITKVVIHSHMNVDKRKNYRIKLGPPDLAVRDLIPRFLLGSSFLCSIPSISYMGQCWIDMIPESLQTVHYAVIEEFVTIQA